MSDKCNPEHKTHFGETCTCLCHQTYESIESDRAKLAEEVRLLKETHLTVLNKLKSRAERAEKEVASIKSLYRMACEEAALSKKQAEELKEAVIVLHIRDSANKKLPHILCHYCDLLAKYNAEWEGGK